MHDATSRPLEVGIRPPTVAVAAIVAALLSGCGGLEVFTETVSAPGSTASVASTASESVPAAPASDAASTSETAPLISATIPSTTTETSTTTLPSSMPPPSAMVLDAALAAQIETCTRYVDDHLLNGNLQACAKGPYVEDLQRALIAWGLGDDLVVDGEFGPATQRAVLLWQVRHGWPEPTTSLEKFRTLGGQIFAILSDPGLPRDVLCPRWNVVDGMEAAMAGPHPYRPMFDMCDESDGIEDLQLDLVRRGYDTPVNGRFDLAFHTAWGSATAAMRGYRSDVVMWDDYWFFLGD